MKELNGFACLARKDPRHCELFGETTDPIARSHDPLLATGLAMFGTIGRANRCRDNLVRALDEDKLPAYMQVDTYRLRVKVPQNQNELEDVIMRGPFVLIVLAAGWCESRMFQGCEIFGPAPEGNDRHRHQVSILDNGVLPFQEYVDVHQAWKRVAREPGMQRGRVAMARWEMSLVAGQRVRLR